MRVEIYGCEEGKYLFHLVRVKIIRLSRLYSNASQTELQHLEGPCSLFRLFQRILDCFGDYGIPGLYGGYVILYKGVLDWLLGGAGDLLLVCSQGTVSIWF